jgi:O-antigen/teichoic acid export membrane protein
VNRLIKNILAISLSDILRRILGFFTVAFLARKLGASSFGAMNIAFTVLSYGLIVSSAGLSSFGTRAIARGDSRSIVNKILSIQLLNSLFVFGLIVGIASFCIPNKVNAELIVLFSLTLFSSAATLDWYFQGKEEMGMIGIARFVSAGLYLLFILVLVASPGDILWVGIAAIIGDVAASITLLVAYRRQSDSQPLGFTLEDARPILRQAFPMNLGSIMATMSINLAPLVLGILLTNYEAGLFSAASKLVFFLLMFDRVLGTLLLPASARFHTRSPEELATRLGVALKFIVLTALPVCAGGTILAPQIVPLIFGAQYVGAIVILRIFIWFFFITMVHTVYTSGMIASGEERQYSKVMVISGILYAVFVILLTYAYGEAGAAGGMVLAEGITVVLMRRQFERKIKISVPRTTIAALPATMLMSLLIMLLPEFPVFLAIGVGAVTYGVFIFLFKGVSMEELRNLASNVS